jgi:hypothetical protein
MKLHKKPALFKNKQLALAMTNKPTIIAFLLPILFRQMPTHGAENKNPIY